MYNILIQTAIPFQQSLLRLLADCDQDTEYLNIYQQSALHETCCTKLNPSGRAVSCEGLRPNVSWDCEFESRTGHECHISCECRVIVCDPVTWNMRRPWPALGCCARVKNNILCTAQRCSYCVISYKTAWYVRLLHNSTWYFTFTSYSLHKQGRPLVLASVKQALRKRLLTSNVVIMNFTFFQTNCKKRSLSAHHVCYYSTPVLFTLSCGTEWLHSASTEYDD